jgi:hypothetical protein
MNSQNLKLFFGLVLLARSFQLLAQQPQQQETDRAQPQSAQIAACAIPPGIPDCTPNATAGYRGKKCRITINRSIPFSPVPIAVPHQTTVYIEVINPRLNETLQFVPSFSKITPLDVLGTAIQTAVSNPLPSLLLSVKTSHLSDFKQLDEMSTALARPITSTEPPAVKALREQQKEAADRLISVAKTISIANTELSCLQAYEGTVQNGSNTACASSPMTDAQPFFQLAQTVSKDVHEGAKLEVPIGRISVTDGIVSDVTKSCTTLQEGGSLTSNPMNLTLANCDQFLQLSYFQKRIDDTMADVLTAEKALQASALVLDTLPSSLPAFTYCMSFPKNVSGTINILTQVPPLTTTTTVASVPLSTGVSHWLISTGIAFSFAGANSFSNAPLFSGGNPVLDSNGKNETVVTQSVIRPTVLTPLVMAHYMIPWLNHRWKWENSCPRHCGFLLSGGVGANLTASQKSADFLGGGSFQIGSVLITPAAHVTWDVQLARGIKVNDQLGSSPPTPLPTTRSLVTKFAIGISYVLPVAGGSTK